MISSLRVVRRVAPVATALLCLACFGRSAPERGTGSALWFAADSEPGDSTGLARLERFGVREVFVEAARLTWSGGTPRFERRTLVAPARRMPATLVVDGEWATGEVDPERVAEKLAAEIPTLEAQAERAGLLVVGVHFDLPLPHDLEPYARALERLRRRLGGRLLLSIDVARTGLDREGLAELARAVDYVVCFLYGQRPGEPEAPDAWDLQAVERNVGRLEKLEARYLLGAALVGSVQRIGPKGRVLEATSTPSLRELVAQPALELVPGFSLEGVDRQVFELAARAPVAVDGLQLAKGERVRVVKTATPFLEELLRRAGVWETPHRLGEVFYRAPRPGEGMAVGLGSLEEALSPEPAQPRLETSVERVGRDERSWTVRVRLTNRGAEPTDLAFFDSNFVELRVRGGRIAEVAPGDFRRYELLRDGREKGTMQALREADTVRLFAPLVEGGDQLQSGDIEIVLRDGNPTLIERASFLLPEGRLLETEAIEWAFSEAAAEGGQAP